MSKLEELRQMSTIGKDVRFYDKGDIEKKLYKLGTVVDEVSQFWSDGNDAYKHFIQRIDRGENGIGYRFCYYTLNAARTKIVFGQYASQIDESDFREFIERAKEKGFL